MAQSIFTRVSALGLLMAAACSSGSSGSPASTVQNPTGGSSGSSPADAASSTGADAGPTPASTSSPDSSLASGGGSGSGGGGGGSSSGATGTGSGSMGPSGSDGGTSGTSGGASTDAKSTASDTGPAIAKQDGQAPANPLAALGHCMGPSGAKWADVQAAYAKWKNDLLTSDGARGFVRVKRPNSPGAINTSNSEGTAYGMILAVAMDDPQTFDGLWSYEQLFLNGNGLMNWEIDPTGAGPTGQGSGGATDADEDMAFALLWANHRWGGKGGLADTYLNFALKQIDNIWAHEVDATRGYALAPGDQFGGAGDVNISYFAPAYYRLFGAANGKQTDWNKVVESSYTILAATLNATNKNATNGLVPAWSTPAGVPQSPNASLPTNHQLDSCRTPFRLGQDFCWYAEPRAKDYLAKISAFYSQIGATHIVNGYNLDGTPAPTNPTVAQSAAFVGPAGVGAMSDLTFAMLRDQAYAGVATLTELDGSTYYTESWTAMSLLMMNGGYWNPTGP